MTAKSFSQITPRTRAILPMHILGLPTSSASWPFGKIYFLTRPRRFRESLTVSIGDRLSETAVYPRTENLVWRQPPRRCPRTTRQIPEVKKCQPRIFTHIRLSQKRR